MLKNKIEGYITLLLLMDQKNQYYENRYPMKSNLQIHCNSNKNYSDIFHRKRKKNLNFIRKNKRHKIDRNPEQKEHNQISSHLISGYTVEPQYNNNKIDLY